MKCDLDRLAMYSPWPARLLGLTPWETRVKTEAEVKREYEGEKWGPLWERVRQAETPVSLSVARSWADGVTGKKEFCRLGDEFVLLSSDEAHSHWVKMIGEVVEPLLPAPALVELGCGFGNVLLPLAKEFNSRVSQLIGCEYTQSGAELVGYLARSEGLNVLSGRCDFRASGICDVPIPENAVIYTSYATHYVPMYTQQFVQAMAALRPSVVLHFEPVYEHTKSDSLLGLMQRRYIELNDYNRNLLTVLREAEGAGDIEIVKETPCFFGRNPLLTASLVAWRPVISTS